MIEDPVQKRSAISMKPNRGFIHSTSSSQMRDRCIMRSAPWAQNSIAKSRSDTASSEFSHTASNPSSFATIWRSIGNEVPASAAAPSGSRLTRRRASAKRWASRANISK
ncbi:hypothetical protein D3C83_09930 [compost metagenome]